MNTITLGGIALNLDTAHNQIPTCANPAPGSLGERRAAEKSAGRYSIITTTHNHEEETDTRKGRIGVDVRLAIIGHHYPQLPEGDDLEIVSVKACGDTYLVGDDTETLLYRDGEDYQLAGNAQDSANLAEEILAEAIKYSDKKEAVEIAAIIRETFHSSSKLLPLDKLREIKDIIEQ